MCAERDEARSQPALWARHRGSSADGLQRGLRSGDGVERVAVPRAAVGLVGPGDLEHRTAGKAMRPTMPAP
jgi:hypothetical protein